METQKINVPTEDFQRLMADVEMIKAILLSHRHGPDPEGELSDWAKKQLQKARATPEEEYVSMEEIESEFS
jgi:hypothetical protein